MACRVDPEGLGDGVVVSARYRKVEQALVQLTRRRARSPRSTLGTATTVIHSAAPPFVPYEDLQVEANGAHRKRLNQAATSEGAKQ
jgi:hypothetical protein